MKRYTKLIILAAVLAVIVGGYFAVSRISKSDPAENSYVDISVVKNDEISSVKWIFGGESVEIKKDANDKWYYAGDKDFPIDSSKTASMISTVCNIRAVKKISDAPAELDVYGIDEPLIRLYVSSDDKTIEYDIGKYNEAAGYYYMMYSGDQALYYVDSSIYSLFSVKLLDIVDFEYLPTVAVNNVISAELITGGKTFTVTADEGNSEKGESELVYYTDGVFCDNETVNDMIKGFTEIKWLSCVDYNADEKEYGKYGLDDPDVSFTLDYRYSVGEDATSAEDSDGTVSGTDTLIIGKKADTEEDAYYAMIKGGKCIYLLSGEIADLYNVEENEALYSRMLVHFDIDEVEYFTVKCKGKTYRIDVAEEHDHDDEGYEIKVYTYKYGDKEMELDDFVSAVSKFRATSVAAEDIATENDELISVSVTMKNGNEEKTVIYRSDSDKCVVSKNGIPRYYADETVCDNIYDSFRHAVA